MEIIVQKFGGTSLTTPELRQTSVKRIKEIISQGYRPVVVVSAMGRSGDPYATDTLKQMAETICPTIPLRELDLLMSCGEIISAAVLTATLWENDIPACTFTGSQAGIVTDGSYSQAQVIDCRVDRLKKCLRDNRVPVVAGFQGAGQDGEINTLGRGGSDTSAVILGVALNAERVDIFTDVNGIATADPKVLKEARIISRLTYSEVCQMAYEGARVIHPAAVEIAMRHNVTVAVRSLNDHGPGTLITGEPFAREKDFRVQSGHAVTGIAHTVDLAQLTVVLDQPDSSLELEIFEQLGHSGISIDLINVFPLLKVFTIPEDLLVRTEGLLKKMGLQFRIERDCAKVSVVGVGMRNMPGVMARVVRALKEKDIEILQTGDSNITISLLIRQKDLGYAIKTLHDHFELSRQGDEAIID